MYVVVMALAMSGSAEVGQCSSSRESCASVQRVTVVRTSCASSANVVAASCSRGGIFQRHAERRADRLDRRADRLHARSGVSVIVVEQKVPTPVKEPTKAK